MIILKKKEIQSMLMQIAGFNKNGEMIAGLLTENISLGMKRRLQKIHEDLLKHYKELTDDLAKLKEQCGEDKEKMEKETNELMDEEVKIDRDFLSMNMIENIQSAQNYNFDLIEKIAQ
jgi:hypothetical protein